MSQVVRWLRGGTARYRLPGEQLFGARVLGLAPALVLIAFILPSWALADPPVPGASYLVWHVGASDGPGPRESLLNINADATAFGDSGHARTRYDQVSTGSAPGRFRSDFRVDSECPNGNTQYTYYSLNGVHVAPDGSFSADIRNVPTNVYSGPDTRRSSFHLRGKLHTWKTKSHHIRNTVSGHYWEVRYLLRKQRLVPYCHTGRAKTHYRVPFSGRARPIQWIIDHSCIACI